MHPRLARRAREIERGMAGEKVPESAWRIALGEESGAVVWADHLRILTAFAAAREAFERSPARAARRRGGLLSCEPAG